MPRRRKSSPLNDLIELVSMLPWWAGLAMAPVFHLLFHAWSARAAVEIATKPQVASGIYYALAAAGQYLLPLVCLKSTWCNASNGAHTRSPCKW